MVFRRYVIFAVIGLVGAARAGSEDSAEVATSSPDTTTTPATSPTTSTTSSTTTTVLETTTTVSSDPVSTTETPVTAGDLEGTWYVAESEGYVRNNTDGTYEVARDLLGLDSNTILQGRFEVDGDTLTLISSAASEFCNEGDTGHYRVELIDADHHRTTLIDDECAIRGQFSVINNERRP